MLALRRYHWQNRIVLVFDQSLDTALLQKQRQWLEQEHGGCVERALIVAYLARDGADTSEEWTIPVEEAARLRAEMHMPSGQFQVVLIGKDGGVKRRWDGPVAPRDLFGVIDAMPMRQQEMRQRGGGGGSTVVPTERALQEEPATCATELC